MITDIAKRIADFEKKKEKLEKLAYNIHSLEGIYTIEQLRDLGKHSYDRLTYELESNLVHLLHCNNIPAEAVTLTINLDPIRTRAKNELTELTYQYEKDIKAFESEFCKKQPEPISEPKKCGGLWNKLLGE